MYRRLGARSVAMGIGLAGLTGLVASSLVGATGCSEDNPQAFAPAPIVIGVSFGLTNDLATFSAPLRDAVRAAEGEINANGGILGRPVRYDIVDDRSDEGAGVSAVIQRFADQNVAAVIGPISSGQAKATAGILAGRQIISISPSATSVELSTLQPDSERFLFRTTPADDFQGAAVVRFASLTPRGIGLDAGTPGDGGAPAVTACSKMGLVYIDNSYGVSMAENIKRSFPKVVPGSAIFEKKLPLAAASSYGAEVGQVFAGMPDIECLALIAYSTAGVQFVRDFISDSRYAAAQSRGFFFIGTDGIYTEGFVSGNALNDVADPSKGAVTNGAFGTNPDTQPGSQEYNAFRTIFASYFPLAAGADAPAFASNAYDAAILAALAVERAGSATDRIRIRDALREVSSGPGRPIGPADIGAALTTLRGGEDIDYKGASGSVDFQANGNVLGGFIIWQVVPDPVKGFAFRTVARFSQDELSNQ